MTPERMQQIEAIFHNACNLAPDERAAFLQQACAGDAALRREVELLLASDEQPTLMPAVQMAALLLIEPEPALLVGQSISHYQILAPLGKGGMGEVYQARDTKLDRTVALKILPAEVATDAERMRRFVREAKAASALNHPHVATIYEIGEAGGLRFIAMEYVEGQMLAAKINGAPLAIKEIIEIGSQMADALDEAHGKGITHRDIKPANVRLTPRGQVKVLDFGLAKLALAPSQDSQASTFVKTQSGVVMGTVPYMSPEQALGRDVDHRSDIFSLGVVLYEMATGRLPFAGSSTSETLDRILHAQPDAMARFNYDVPAELERIVRKCLEKERERRYQSARELLVDLKALAGQLTQTQAQPQHTNFSAPVSTLGVEQPTSQPQPPARRNWWLIALAGLLLIAAGFFAYRFFTLDSKSIESIAVLPFLNASGNAEVEYLSDGMTESLINSLSQLPKLSVKARSTVFHYKNKEIAPQTIAAALSVQAILNGRVVQRGDDLTLYLSLVDGRSGDQLWGEQYDRKMTDLVTLQSEITRDVSRKLQARLSGADEQRLTKNYTQIPEAYQLYLRGRFHLLKTTRVGYQTAISYYQQAIAIEPNYALAYAGLADAYRSLSLAGELPAREVMPQAKAAANKALEIDDSLAEAHAYLGFILYLYEWDWNAAEKQLKRAIELDPNNGDTRIIYADMLVSVTRYSEALAQARRAAELDPLNLRVTSLEARFLTFAGKPDEALARLEKVLELNPNFWFALQFQASALIDKGMYAEAVASARKSLENNFNTRTASFLCYALAKSGKTAEARAELDKLLKLSQTQYVPPYNIAAIYNGLGERDETIRWLERGIEERDPRMPSLKAEQKWNNLRDDPRFKDLLRRIGFP